MSSIDVDMTISMSKFTSKLSMSSIDADMTMPMSI
jgi:hypothetical protein